MKIIITSAASLGLLLAQVPNPTNQDIERGMTNVCRCGTYSRVRAAIHTAADLAKGDAS